MSHFQLGSSRGALKLWFLTQGPAHCKSTSWFDDILVQQVVQVCREGFQTTWQHPTTQLGGELAWVRANRFSRHFSPDIRVPGGQSYTQYAVIACACMDRPAADLCAGRAGHGAKLACGFGVPCAGATGANAADGDDANVPSVLPKKGAHVPGNSTVTWHRLLDEQNVANVVLNEPPDASAVKQVTRHNWFPRKFIVSAKPVMTTSVQVLLRLQAAEGAADARAKLTKIAKETGWVHLGFLGKLSLELDFDLVRDLVVDLMHLCMVLIKDLAYVTAGVLTKVTVRVCFVKTGYVVWCR